MLLAHHCILGFYGIWLPNDPRGSGSDYVASWDLFRYGPATKTDSASSVAHVPHDHAARLRAKAALRFSPVAISREQVLVVAQGFSQALQEAGYSIHACAILSEHLHLVVAWHPRAIRRIIGHLRSKATSAVRKQGLWDQRPLWGEHAWNVRLNDTAAVERGIRYVERNPEKEGQSRQHWMFVTPFDARSVAVAQAKHQRTGTPAQPRRIAGAVQCSREERLQSEQRWEQESRSKRTSEVDFD